MIIVEGPDGAGKSMLIEKLQQRWKLPVAKRVVNKDTQAIGDLRVWVEQNIRQGWKPIIFDRHRMISEPVYGPILRGDLQDPTFINRTWMLHHFQRFYELQPLIIYCLPPFEVVQANVWQDEDNSVVRSHITAIYSAYVAKASMDSALRSRCTVVYDYTSDGREQDPTGCFGRWDRIIEARKDW